MTTYLYAAIAIVGAALGGFLTHLYENGRVGALKLQHANYVAQVAADKAIAQAAANAALQSQLDSFKKVSKENEDVIASLHAKLAQSESQRASDRVTAGRLFHDAAQASCGNPVPKGSGEQGSPKPSGTPSLDQLANACSDLAAEDSRNADRLDALITEVKGNL